MKQSRWSVLALTMILLCGCGASDDTTITTTDSVLKIKFRFAPDQERLDNTGNNSTLPSGHAAQTPRFNAISAHFIELVPDEFTPYKTGAALYQGSEVPANNPNNFGFTTAIDFDQASVVTEEEIFIEVPLSNLTPGTYEHLHVSVTYQNYDVVYNLNNVPVAGDLPQQSGTLASFVGFNTYINQLKINELETTIAAARLQGFWGFATQLAPPYSAYNQLTTGQAPAAGTTVVNPFPAALIPQGSCVVSGSFDSPLEITGEETNDIVVVLSFSTNQSFEWEDDNGNGEWDIDAQDATQSEKVVDMGLRGLRAFVE